MLVDDVDRAEWLLGEAPHLSTVSSSTDNPM
jgi:hypothetical protein